MFLRCAALVLGGLSLLARPLAAAPSESNGEPPTSTFSIVGCDTATGEWGVAVSSKFLAVGSVVPWAMAGAGAVATQAFANTSFGPEGLDLLSHGKHAAAVLDRLVAADPAADSRQVGIVDRQGNGVTFTGKGCLPWAGGLTGPGCAAQGNTLAGEAVVSAMVQSFNSTAGRPLAERLLLALEAGEGEGGDSRGKQSAALVVVRQGGGYGGFNDRYVDLRVDDAADPITELARLYRLHARAFLPAVHSRLGDAARERGDRIAAEREYSRVIHLYHEAMEADPTAAEPRNGLAWFFVEHRMNLTEAQTLAEEANRLAPQDWQVMDTLAEIYFTRGELDKASAMASRAADAHPENGYLQQQAARFRQAIAQREGL
jgi:uncharacterized Ntn-hydrolase superfamily protein